MSIVLLNQTHMNKALNFWNSLMTHDPMVYKPLSTNEFITKFHAQSKDIDKRTYLDIEDNILRAMISGVYVQEKKKAYISTIVCLKENRRQKIASSLLKYFEESLIKDYPEIESIDIVFFNPVQFEWYIPNTPYHDHPNAPGIELDSEAYYFFLSNNYSQFAKQNVYYKSIENYTYLEHTKRDIHTLEHMNIHITLYDNTKHKGLSEFLDCLNNTYWKTEILKASFDNKPVLIAEKDGLVIGFTGPLGVQSSKRGYFAGIGVDQAYRGKKIGAVLFSSLCYELSHMGAHFMTLFTGENNPARNIYEKEGFTICKSWANMRKEIKK